MTPDPEFLGYGFSPEALAAAWQELEAELPVKGPECPYTLDLIELALGSAALLDVARLQGHVEGCAYCHKRFESLRQAARGPLAPPAVPPRVTTHDRICEALRGFRLVGPPAPPLNAALELAAKDGPNPIVHRIPLRPAEGDSLLPLNLFLVWREPATGQPSGEEEATRSVQLIFPSDQLDREYGNAEAELTRLNGHQARLGLRGRLPNQGREWSRRFTTRLDWRPEQQQLASPEVRVRIEDPHSLTEVGFSPLEQYGGIDAT